MKREGDTRMSNNRLGELLVREKLISLAQLRSAQEEQQRSGKTLGYTLARLGVISDDDITKFLSHQYRVPTINLDEYEIEPEILKLVSREQCERHRVIPVSRAGSSLVVAMTDPTNLNAIDDLKFLTGYNVEPVIASETAITQAIERHYNAGPSYDEVMAGFDENEIDFSAEDADLSQMDLERASEDAPVVRLVNMILLNAIKKGASDIHIEPYEKKYRVRYRIDGVLHEEMQPPIKLKAAISSRLKIMSQLDIAERRLPQDGRIKLKLGKGREMDFRVSVLPTLWGEKIVMRLLDKSSVMIDLGKLGFTDENGLKIEELVSQPNGMAISSDGDDLYVAVLGNDKVVIYDTGTLEDDDQYPDEVDQIAVSGGGPTGLVLDGPRDRLYVMTRFDNGISIIDTDCREEVGHLTMHNPEPPSIVAGRRFLYEIMSPAQREAFLAGILKADIVKANAPLVGRGRRLTGRLAALSRQGQRYRLRHRVGHYPQ